MSLMTREMAAQANGEAQKHSRLTAEPGSEHLALDRRSNQQLVQRNGADSGGKENTPIENPPSSAVSTPKQNAAGANGVNGLADFFSQEVFHIVLHNPTTAHRLLKFSQARMCGENMEFLEKVRTSSFVYAYSI